MNGIVSPCFFYCVWVVPLTKSALHRAYNHTITELFGAGPGTCCRHCVNMIQKVQEGSHMWR